MLRYRKLTLPHTDTWGVKAINGEIVGITAIVVARITTGGAGTIDVIVGEVVIIYVGATDVVNSVIAATSVSAKEIEGVGIINIGKGVPFAPTNSAEASKENTKKRSISPPAIMNKLVRYIKGF